MIRGKSPTLQITQDAMLKYITGMDKWFTKVSDTVIHGMESIMDLFCLLEHTIISSRSKMDLHR
jgi:hypothetical protein